MHNQDKYQKLCTMGKSKWNRCDDDDVKIKLGKEWRIKYVAALKPNGNWANSEYPFGICLALL